MKRATAVLLLLIGLICVYLFVSKEEQSVPTRVVLDEKAGSEATPSHGTASPESQAVPAQLPDTGGSISSRPHEQSAPALPPTPAPTLYGAMLSGRGKLYADDFQFRVVDESVAVTAKPIPPQRSVARGRIADPGREPRNLDFEETAVRTDAFSQ